MLVLTKLPQALFMLCLFIDVMMVKINSDSKINQIYLPQMKPLDVLHQQVFTCYGQPI